MRGLHKGSYGFVRRSRAVQGVFFVCFVALGCLWVRRCSTAKLPRLLLCQRMLMKLWIQWHSVSLRKTSSYVRTNRTIAVPGEEDRRKAYLKSFTEVFVRVGWLWRYRHQAARCLPKKTMRYTDVMRKITVNHHRPEALHQAKKALNPQP